MAALRDVPDLGLDRVHRGKVRDLFDAGDDRLLMVASDRLSAFDVVMDEPVPDKGRVLTAMSAHWFGEVADVVGNHLLSTDVADLPATAQRPELAGRIMLCRRARMLPVECIVRAFVAGSAWKEYRSTGTIHGMLAPAGLVEADRLPEPIFTPSTKAAVGDHDENITFDAAVALVGGPLAERLRDVSLAVFARAAAAAEAKGFLLADTKFELGLVSGPGGADGDTDGDDGEQLVLADEVLTPDSSRYWLATDWAPGATPQGFDKQPVRDFLETLDWDKAPPPPRLPDDVVAATRERYVSAYERICGRSLADWPGA